MKIETIKGFIESKVSVLDLIFIAVLYGFFSLIFCFNQNYSIQYLIMVIITFLLLKMLRTHNPKIQLNKLKNSKK